MYVLTYYDFNTKSLRQLTEAQGMSAPSRASIQAKDIIAFVVLHHEGSHHLDTILVLSLVTLFKTTGSILSLLTK